MKQLILCNFTSHYYDLLFIYLFLNILTVCHGIFLSRTEEPAKAGTCAYDRRALHSSVYGEKVLNLEFLSTLKHE